MQDLELKSYILMLVEGIRKNFNNSLKEIQENTAKEVEVLKEIQGNTTKQEMELNKTIQDLKREVDTIKKNQSDTTLEIETLEKKSGTIDSSISNRIQEIEEKISGTEDSIEHMGKMQRKGKMQKDPNSNIQEIQDTLRRPNLQIIGVDENEGPANIFNKIIEENFPNLKKEMPMNIQDAYRTPRNSSRHIII
jgi:chromosome segregation ATPase